MKWALALSGGGSLGLSHLGVIKVLQEENLIPDLICGTSMGAIMGGLWASGKSWQEMTEILDNLDIPNLTERMTFKWKLHNNFVRLLQAEEALGALFSQKGLDQGKRIRELLDSLFEGKNFSNTIIPFLCNAVNLYSGDEILLDSGSLTDAIYASSAFPGVLAPLSRDNTLLADGSILRNLPVKWAWQKGIRRVISVQSSFFHETTPEEINNGLDVIFRSFIIASRPRNPERTDKPSLNIKIDNTGSSLDYSEKENLILKGEQAALSHIHKIKKILKYPWPSREKVYD